MKNILIYRRASILEALNRLNDIKDVSRLILFVIDSEEKVLGAVTDGDIRRALVSGETLQTPIEKVCNRNFAFVERRHDYLNLHKHRKKKLKILPVLNPNGTCYNILDLEKINAVLPMECMIMAGGRGKRLSPLTDTVPKPMLPLGGKPIIEYNIDRLISFGITKIYISLRYLGEQIQDYFGDGSSKNIEIEYIREDKSLGTAGALSLVEKFETEHVLLMNSDLFTNANFEGLYLSLTRAEAEMAVASIEYKVDIPYAIFETNGSKIHNFKEKPSYIYQANAGIYILKRELINEIPKNEYYDITDLMDKLVNENRKLVFDPILGYWIDIGKPVDYQKAQNFVEHINSQ